MLPLLLLAASVQDLTVLPEGAHAEPYAALLEESRSLQRGHAAVAAAARGTLAGARAHRAAARAAYGELLGPMPVRTPLETTVVGVLDAGGYRVERLLFQSRPGHHVTANLYVPDGAGPFPGVAVPCGHSDNGKAYDSYQRACALLARSGIVALIYDPVGQGERHQLDLARHGTTEHELANAAGLLVGEPLAKHELWDGVRAIDVLLARPELGGATRVGLAGNSGGGTQTVFLAAFDERVAVATPACYVMEHQRLFETIGPQDGCQWIPGEGALGLDHADYLAMFAPRPLRVLAAEQDFFEFASTRRAVDTAGEVWGILGASDRLDLLATPEGHGWSRALREGCASWMTRWLLGREEPVVEPDLEVFSGTELQVTSTGQVRTAFAEERTLVDLYEERAKTLRAARGPVSPDAVRAVIGYRELHLEDREVGRRELGGLPVVLHVAEGAGVALPAIEVRPPPDAAGASAAWTVVLHEDGKRAALDLLLDRARAGRRAVAVDLWGYGELADRGADAKFRNPEHRLAALALHNGRPLLGRRVGQLLGWLRSLGLDEEEDVELIGVGHAGVTALHAAYLAPRISRVELRGTIASWEEVLRDPASPGHLGNVVPRVLAAYDLPDLEAALGDRVRRR